MRKTTTTTRGAVAKPVERLLLVCSCSSAQLLQRSPQMQPYLFHPRCTTDYDPSLGRSPSRALIICC